MLPIIISDIDGVVCNLIEETILKIWQDFKILLSPELCTDYNTAKAFHPYLTDVFDTPKALDKYLWARVWKSHEALLKARPYYETLVVYREYMAKGGHLKLFTARDSQLSESTSDWCEQWGLPLPRMNVYDKAAWLRGFLVDLRCGGGLVDSEATPVWIIDDSPEALESMAKVEDDNLTVFRMDRPWNRTSKAGCEWPLESIRTALTHIYT